MSSPELPPGQASVHSVVVVQHLAFEEPGSFEPVLRENGAAVTYLQAGVDDLSAGIRDADVLVLLGGPIGVYETDAYPFLKDEIEAIQSRLSSRRPTLGICLGAQLMAQAQGGRVFPGGRKEIGWGELSLSAAGQVSALKHLAGVRVLHWHGDTFDLPPGAEHLAASPLYQNQAFQLGPNVLALQCHPEAEARTFERWLIGHAAELNGAGIDIVALRREAAQFAGALEQAGAAMLREWLRGLGRG